jgi:hypothetical protein
MCLSSSSRLFLMKPFGFSIWTQGFTIKKPYYMGGYNVIPFVRAYSFKCSQSSLQGGPSTMYDFFKIY